jgi:peptidoglycan/xylan/chitin deacetylase (PgdA/CDA1 family)
MSLHTKTKKAFVSKDEFEDDTGKAKEKIESIYGKKIIGYRAPGAYIGKWMFESLINLGFKYDSSVTANSLYNKTDFKTSHLNSVPYWIDINDSRLLEIPWPYFKIGPIRFPTGGGPFLRLFPAWYSIKGIRESLKRGDSVYYWHPYDVNEQRFPEIASKNKRRPFFFKKSSKNGEKKMRQIIESFSGKWACCEDVYKKKLTTQP